MSFQKTKIDGVLGQAVHEHLVKIGLETPVIDSKLAVDAKDKIADIEQHMTKVMETLGYDLSDDSLIDTPKRIAKMMVLETMWGLLPENFPKVTTVENKMGYNEMLVERNVKVMSQCEHHFVTIDGFAHVAYIPKDKVLGLSKINRIVEYFSRRGQIQERLTQQILETLKFILETDDVAVQVDAVHYCVRSRGVEDLNSRTVTSSLSGAFKNDPATRAEFMSLCKGAN